ncbi:hypothetical protein V5P93_006715 [Actinokineospora auranticolor]|uniref:Uncharacterized protein n=1 Tax=Actinokineospora auranticolor TaxID=155976 RepID=A0A2S6GWW3_9PSEU|nr:hypothetical protein [Actinokineospora auranticolor]PPK69641.1 hypothetical protein CLV40_103251 [Actinokineospora auranticolor]
MDDRVRRALDLAVGLRAEAEGDFAVGAPSRCAVSCRCVGARPCLVTRVGAFAGVRGAGAGPRRTRAGPGRSAQCTAGPSACACSTARNQIG